MLETSKQVRVDNWGIYFLQRLQLFFSKTDYCDLTLQFEGNVQLKVHRLVMNACTEYFAFLEQTCPALEENTILMPSDLQADVIVPIVNFMYTGMLEFHPSIFEKLYKAAETMNIAVLTKLLEAQLHRFKVKPKKDVPHSWGAKKAQKPPAAPVTNELPSPLPGKKLPIWRKRQNMQPAAHPVSATFSNTKWNSDPPEKDPLHLVDNTPKPTRFEWPDDDQPPFSVDPSFDDVSLTSKPLWTKEDDHKVGPTFEEARAIAQRSRHSSKNNSLSQDNEEFMQKEQKVYAAQLDEVEVPCESALKRKADTKVTSSPKRVKITNQDDETIISIKTNNPNELDHTKIVSEILKRYPDLVKSKKNIKLKITATKNEPTQIKLQTLREKAKVEVTTTEKPSQPAPVKKEVKMESATHKESGYGNTYKKRTKEKADFRAVSEDGPWTCMECLGDGEAPEFVLYYLFRKHMTDIHHMEFDASLCKYCGRKCPSDRDMAYHLYTKHGLRPPSNINFPKCMMCPFIGVSKEKLQEHIKNHKKEEEQCVNCKLGFESNKDLLNHQQMIGHHSRTALSILDCGYCPKKLQSPVTLFTHIRTQHMKEARRDGITSLEEFMDIPDDRFNNAKHVEIETAAAPQKVKEVVETNKIEEKQQQVLKERVNIISNVKVATKQEETAPGNGIRNAVVEQEVAEPIAVATTTAATLGNIGGSLATNLGLVDIVVLDDNQQYILQQPEGQSGNAEFILPELSGNEGILQAATAAADLNSTDELVMVLTDHDYQDEQNQEQSDNSNIVVLYSHPVEGQQGQFITSQGNLLVNSEGLIEIRNGAGITTTAGQILVNSNNTTTTTQAIESPIESIELIRKEIEGEVEREVPRGNVRAVLRKKVLEKDLNKIVKRPGQIKENSQSMKENLDTSLENGESESDQLLDTTDSSIQEEPMEVEEIGPQERESVEAGIGEENNQLLDDSAEKEESEPVLPAISETPSEDQGQDVPPDTQNTTEENSETPKGIKVYTSSESVILNDPGDYTQNYGSESEKTDVSAEVEPMEVDGAKLNQSTDQIEIEGKDEVDGDLNASEEKEFDNGDQMEESLNQNLAQPQLESEAEASQPDLLHQHVENDDHSKPPEENNEEQDLVDEQQPFVETEETQNQDDLKEDQDQAPDMENDQVPVMENDQVPVMENDQVPNMENDQAPDMENDQVPVVENDHAANMENDHSAENDQNDQNDNVQPNFDDFTDESQQSSGQKVHRDLNKEILDDWDDTDSQQSQSHERDSQEDAQEQAALNAAENVNKLMDDWDEEDEDQSKE